MGKVDDLKAYREWNEYHSSLKRDMAVDSLSDAERRRKLARLEKDPVEWIGFFSANTHAIRSPASIRRPSGASV